MLTQGRMLLSRCIAIWQAERPTRHAAALAYYSMFALAPILYVMLRIAGRFFSTPVVVDAVTTALLNLLGPEVTGYIQELVANTAATTSGGSTLTTLISMGALLYAATGFFVHLQRTLNAIWETTPPAQGTVIRFLVGRMLAFVMVVGLGAALVIAVFAGTLINLLQSMFGISTRFQFGYLGVLFGLGTLTFAVIFRILPAARVRWRHCLAGGAVTTLLITVGGVVLLTYLRISQVGTAFEAAGSLAVVLIGVYYAAQLFLAGAVFTRALGQ